MATYTVQFVTKQGAMCTQTITNRARAMLLVQDGEWGSGVGCVVLVIAANSGQERIRLKGVAVSQVFHERVRAIEWLKQQLGEENV